MYLVCVCVYVWVCACVPLMKWVYPFIFVSTLSSNEMGHHKPLLLLEATAVHTDLVEGLWRVLEAEQHVAEDVEAGLSHRCKPNLLHHLQTHSIQVAYKQTPTPTCLPNRQLTKRPNHTTREQLSNLRHFWSVWCRYRMLNFTRVNGTIVL